MAGLNLGWLGLAPKKWNKAASNFMTGSPEIRENVSTLRPEQEQGFNQLQQASQGPGAGGAFGQASDYYRNLLSDNPEDFNRFAAPEQRNFNENIIPGLSEQFAGMGSGGLTSSGFRNAAVGAGTDLSERLGALRAQFRQQGAQGLQGIGQQALGGYSQNMTTQPGSEGFLSQAASAIPHAAAAYFSGGSSIPGSLASLGSNRVGRNTSPYGQQPQGQIRNF